MIKIDEQASGQESKKKSNKSYDIRLKKITMKNNKKVFEEIPLEINSFGKYCVTKT